VEVEGVIFIMDIRKYYYGPEPAERKFYTNKEIAEAGYELDKLAKKYIRDHNLSNDDYDIALDRVCDDNPELAEQWSAARL
jgi:hypothetical protein